MRNKVIKFIAIVIVVALVFSGCNVQIDRNQDSDTSGIAGKDGEDVSESTSDFNWIPVVLNSAASHPANIAHEGVLAGRGEKLYFLSGGESQLTICDNNGENLLKMGDSIRGSINLCDKYIYYLSDDTSSSIIKQSINDGEKTTVFNESDVWKMALIEDRIFFITYDGQSNETGDLYSIESNGTNLCPIDSQVLVCYLDFDDSNIYYAKMTGETTYLFKYDIKTLSGSELVTVSSTPKQKIHDYIVVEDYLAGELYLQNIVDGSSDIIFSKDTSKSLCSVGANGNMVFFTTQDPNTYEFTLYAFDINAKTEYCLGNVHNSGICFVEDNIYTIGGNDNFAKEVIENGVVTSIPILPVSPNVS